jgi:hypothetical protein
MYFGDMNIDAATHFLNGLESAVSAWLAEDVFWRARQEVIKGRGWTFNARHPSAEMSERGLSPGQIIDEMLVIEIDILVRLGGRVKPLASRYLPPEPPQST